MSQQSHRKIAIMLAILCTTSIATHADETRQDFSPLCPTFQPGFQRLADYQKISDHKKIAEDFSFISRTSAPGGSSLLTALNGLATSLSNLATAPIMNSTALARSQSSTNTINSLLMPFSKNLDSNSIAPLLQALNNSTTALKAASLNSNFSTSNRGAIASSLLNASTLFNNVAYSSNFSVQSDIDTAATSAIAFVAILDTLATQWSVTGSLNSTNTNARSALADFLTLTGSVYIYTPGTATVAQIKTASSTIAAYVAQLMSLKSFIEYSTPSLNFQTITLGPDSNLWVTDNSNSSPGIWKISANGTTTSYTTSIGSPVTITTGSDNNLWFTDWNNNAIGKISTSGDVEEYSVDSTPFGICLGPDNNIWFTEVFAGKIGKISPSGTITKYNLSDSNCYPHYIVAGADGNLWFTELKGNKIGRITTSGSITEFTVPTYNSEPRAIAAGPDGNIWFTEVNANKIGKITPAGDITEYALSISSPMALVFDQKGFLWCKGNETSLIRMDIQTGTITPFTTPSSANSSSSGMAIDATGTLWYTQQHINKIGTLQLP